MRCCQCLSAPAPPPPRFAKATVSRNGAPTLHQLLQYKAPEHAILDRISTHPDEAQQADNGMLPLHSAALHGGTEAIVASLLLAWPAAAGQRSHSGLLPLHYAVWYGASPTLVRMLLAAFPDGAKTRTTAGGGSWLPWASDTGALPLHLAARAQAPAEVVSMLLARNPHAARALDRDGYSPLHHQCRNGSPLAAVEAMLAQCPKAAALEDRDNGWLPLHCAAMATQPVEGVLAAVLAAYPWGAKVQDRFGMLPLYYAHHNKAKGGVAIRMAGNLVRAFPEGKKQLDERGWRKAR